MIPQAELESSMDTSSVGQQARLMSKALRKLVCAVAQKKVLLIFINQIRLKIGVMFGNPETTTGGVGLKFFSSVRLEVAKGPVIKLQDVIKGQEVRVKVIKNKCAPPFQNTTFKLYYDTGIDHIDELVELATELDIIKKSGSWFSFQEKKLAQGKDATVQLLRQSPNLYEEIYSLTFPKSKKT